MLRLGVLISLTIVVGAMETRETVERMVLVRTTGSDLQPAATGYIYKRDHDGPESLVRMGESEVMEHLSKLYTRPVHERVAPVNENHQAHADGIADVDYKKMFDDLSSSHYGDDSDSHAYNDYLKGLKHFKGGLYHKYDGDSAEDEKDSKNHHYGNGDAGSYHNAKFESYSISGGHKKDHDDGNAHKKHYDHYRGKIDEQDTVHGKEDGAQESHSIEDDSDHKDDHEYFGKGVKAFADQHKYYGSGDTGHQYHGYNPKRHGGQGDASAEEQEAKPSSEQHSTSSDETPGDVGSQSGQTEGKSFGYEVKH